MKEETTTRLQEAADFLKPWTVETRTPEPPRLDVVVEASNFLAALKAVVDARWGYLSAITGLDCPAPAAAEGETPAEGKLEALYHFCRDEAVLTLRVKVPYSDPRIPSVCQLIPSGTLFERELIELFGFDIVDTPNREHLLLPDDWPAGVYPLRKSFTGLENIAQA